MFRNDFKEKELIFGCQAAAVYKESFIMDSANSFTLCPDGQLSLKDQLVGFGKVYSLRRLQPDYVEELTQDLQRELLVLEKKGTILQASIARHKDRIKESIANLQQEVKLQPELTPLEKVALDILEQKLMPAEMQRLESRKTAIIIVPDLKELNSEEESKAQYVAPRNAIFIKQDCLHCSLIHEVQHSLERDISCLHPMRFFKFYNDCKKMTVTSRGVQFVMVDEMNVLAHEQKAKADSENKPLQYKIRRAKYLLSLHNYAPRERDQEILGHLRQFIADFGTDETAKLLPRLYQYWVNDVLETYPATNKMALM